MTFPIGLQFTGVVGGPRPSEACLTRVRRRERRSDPSFSPVDEDALLAPGQPIEAVDVIPSAPVAFDHDGLANRRNVPLKFGHDDTDMIIGWAEALWPDGGLLRSRGFIARDTPEGRIVSESSAAGFRWGLSIGVRLNECELAHVREHEFIVANGRTYEGPVVIVRRWRIDHIAVGLDVVDNDASLTATMDPDSSNTLPWIANLLRPSIDPTARHTAFVDALARRWRVVTDSPGAAMVRRATGVELSALDMAAEPSYTHAVLADRGLLTDVLYCLAVDPFGRRCSFTRAAFRAGFPESFDRSPARAALLNALNSFRTAARAAVA